MVTMRKALPAVVLVFVVCGFAAAGFTPDLTAGAEVGIGYTIVDLPTALEWDQDYFQDWSQLYLRTELHAFFFEAGGVLLGATAAWNHLYYYWVRVPYVPTPLTYEGTVQPISIGAVAELAVFGNVVVRPALNLMIFGDGVTVGIRPTILYRLPLAERLVVSAGLTIDVIFGSGVPIGAGATVGVDYAIPLKR
jgi:hypothetical protein